MMIFSEVLESRSDPNIYELVTVYVGEIEKKNASVALHKLSMKYPLQEYGVIQ